jgi:dihydrofolate synthase/folylpolyglutamate synthase
VKYEETIEWMFSLLPMYQRQGKTAYKKDLTNIVKLSEHLGNPHKQFKSIHIAGTNGKGSTSHMLASIFQEAGYKTGLYTSPHLKDFRERIRINGKMIRKNCVINFIKRNRKFILQNNLSFFELSVGMAFEYFAKKNVDIAIIETGLGGRLDSTNIITPELSIITNISLDHTHLLGDNFKKIAFEKGGIIKKNIPVILGERHPETFPVFDQIAQEKDAPLYLSFPIKNLPKTDLLGAYQQKNIQTVLTAVDILRKNKFAIPDRAIETGLQKVTKNTGLRGRWEILNHSPLTIADTAHNEAGIIEVMKQLSHTPHDKLHIVLSFVRDKNLIEILKLFPKEAQYYFAKADIPRGLDAQLLKEKARLLGLKGDSYSSIQAAYQQALNCATKNDIIFIGGSTFTVAEII